MCNNYNFNRFDLTGYLQNNISRKSRSKEKKMLYRHLHRDGRTKEEIPLVRGDAKIPEDGALLFSKNGKPRGWRAAVKLFSNRSPFTAPPMLEKYCSNRANNNGADGFKPRSAPPPSLENRSSMDSGWMFRVSRRRGE